MPKPTLRNYHPDQLGAKCYECPLACRKQPVWPVPPLRVSGAKAALVLESPGGSEKFTGVAMQSNAAQRLKTDLTEYGLPPGSYHALYRIACTAPNNKRTDSITRKAAAACLPRFKAEARMLKINSLPRAYFGKWAPIGTLPRGEHNQGLEIKLSQNVIRNNATVLQHPRIPYFHKPAGREAYRTYLRRFADFANGELVWPKWDESKIILHPSGPDSGERALHALRNMGPIIAYDAETLGTDPLTAPITAISISDGNMTVALGWVSYSNRHGYHVGVADTDTPIARALVTEVKTVLESDRTMVLQNGNYDIMGMEGIGIHARMDFDCLDAYKIINPEMPGNLEALGVHLMLLPERWKTLFRAGRDDDAKGATEFAESPQLQLLGYNARDSLVTRLLYEPLRALLAVED